MSNHEEPSVVTALVELAKRCGVRCCVQIGAEDGYEAAMVALACGGRAIAIEGDERCASYGGVEYHHAVIGATDGPASFHVCSSGSGLSSTLKRVENVEIHEVTMQRLDTFCTARGIRPDMLIIDTEGTTLDVLQGCGTLLDHVRLIYAEVQVQEIRPGVSLLPAVSEFMATRGFTTHDGLPSYPAGGQGNYSFVKMP